MTEPAGEKNAAPLTAEEYEARFAELERQRLAARAETLAAIARLRALARRLAA